MQGRCAGRCGGDAGEMLGRCGGDAGGCRGDAGRWGEMQPRRLERLAERAVLTLPLPLSLPPSLAWQS